MHGSAQSSDTIGLVVPDITNPFFPSLVQAVEHAARERGLAVLIANSGHDAEVEREALRTLVDRRVDAVLISPAHVTDSLPALTETVGAVRTIQIDCVVDETIPYVRANQSDPVNAIIDHLLRSERRHLAFITERTTISNAVGREAAFSNRIVATFPDEPLRVVREESSAESTKAAVRQIMRSWPDTDAIMCANDLIAVGVLQELGMHPGRREVAVSGFDDSLIARTMRLTSVRQPVEQMAEAAVSGALDADESGVHLAREFPSQVMFRFSTA